MPYIGEIRLFAGSFAPVGWAFCNGQLMPISENDALFNLIGTTYGGDGQETFGLPNLQSRVPIHMGANAGTTYLIGQSLGVESVTLTTQQLPAHPHQAFASTGVASLLAPTNGVLAQPASVQPGMMAYAPPPANVIMNAAAITSVGGGQPHDNMQPFVCLSFIISLYGVYPSQT